MAMCVPSEGAHAHATDPSGTYRWVSPPPEREGDNMPPRSVRITRTADDLPAVWTPDFQFRMSWSAEALSAGRAADFEVTPLDANRLASLPDGYEANGNAYRVRVRSLDLRAHPAKVTLVVPSPDPVVYRSVEGDLWARVPSVVNAMGQAVVELRDDGFLVAAVRHEDSAPLITPARAWIAGGAAVLAFEVWRRLRARRPAVVAHRSPPARRASPAKRSSPARTTHRKKR